MPFPLALLLFLLSCTFFGCLSGPTLTLTVSTTPDQSDAAKDGDGSASLALVPSGGSDLRDGGLNGLVLTQAYLDHDRFPGLAGVSRPQIPQFGELLFFEARGPPGGHV